MTDVTSLDSGYDATDGVVNHSEPCIRIRVTMPEIPSFQTIFFINPLDHVWALKQKVLSSVTQDLKDPINYGFYLPPSNNRVGKYLDEERPIKEYPLSGPIGLLEFKYKRRMYKTDLNPLRLKKMHTPSELKAFLELVRRSDVDQITVKTSKGFDPNFNSVLKGESPLTLAASLQRPGAVILALVGGGAFIDYRNKAGQSPLHVATLHGNKDAVRILLDLGSSPNYKDSKGLTPLAYATMKETPALCIQWLLQERADIGRKDENGWMEIHHACQHGLMQHLEQLLFYGADRNAVTNDKARETPLHICARFNQVDCARLLLLRGSDKTLKDASGKDAEAVARAVGHDSIAKLISDFREEHVELFNDVPKYNEKRRGTISMVTLRNLQRSRSNPDLLQQLFQQDPVLSATVSQSSGIQYVSNGLVPVKSSSPHGRLAATDLFGTGVRSKAKHENHEPALHNHVERLIELHRRPEGFGFILRGPLDPPGSTLNFIPTADVPARQYIESLEPNSAAADAGLEQGDFILEINGQNVIFESHKDCVQLMRNGGDVLKLKVIKVQQNSPTTRPKSSRDETVVTGTVKTRESSVTNSLSSSGSSQAKTALAGLEALENLDATLDNYDGAFVSPSRDEIDSSPIIPPAPAEFATDTTVAPVEFTAETVLPPPPSYDETSHVTSEPEPLLSEVLAAVNVTYVVTNGHSDEPEPDYDSGGGKEGLTNGKAVKLTATQVSVKSEEEIDHKKIMKLSVNEDKTDVVKKQSVEELPKLTTSVKTEDKMTGMTIEPNRKKYSAPPPPQAKTQKSPTASLSRVAAGSAALAVVASDKIDTSEEHHVKTSASLASSDSTAQSAFIPPPPPPPLTLNLTLPVASRSHLSSPDTDKTLPIPSTVQKQLDESKKREEGHAALMAAVMKRKNVLDSSDSDQLAESIDARVDRTRKLQKTFYVGNQPKEIKSPPTTVTGIGLLTSQEGNQMRPISSSVENDSSGFSAEAEKIRQAFVLKKTTSKEFTSEAPVSPVKEEVKINDVVKAPAPAPPLIAASVGVQSSTMARTPNRPQSAEVNAKSNVSNPTLADVAAMIAEKALARQKREEMRNLDEEKRPKTIFNSSANATEVKENTLSHANRKSTFESNNNALSPANSTTLPKSSITVKTNSTSFVSPQSPHTFSTLQTKKYGANVASSAPATSAKQNTSADSSKGAFSVNTPLVVTTLSRTPETSGKKNSDTKQAFVENDVCIPPPVEFASPSDSGFSTDVYVTATLRNVSKSVPSNSMVFRAKGAAKPETEVAKSFQERPISTWTENDVGEWVEGLDYPEYRPLFTERKITGATLASMTNDQMDSIGIKNLLHRIRLVKEIRKAVEKK